MPLGKSLGRRNKGCGGKSNDAVTSVHRRNASIHFWRRVFQLQRLHRARFTIAATNANARQAAQKLL